MDDELLGLHRLETFKVVVLRNIALPLSPPTALSSIFALVIVQTDTLQNGKWALSQKEQVLPLGP